MKCKTTVLYRLRKVFYNQLSLHLLLSSLALISKIYIIIIKNRARRKGENYVYDLGSITYISEFLICYHRYRQENLFNFRLNYTNCSLGCWAFYRNELTKVKGGHYLTGSDLFCYAFNVKKGIKGETYEST